MRARNLRNEETVRIVVSDSAGGNEVKLMAARGRLMGWIEWLPTRSTIAAPVPTEKRSKGATGDLRQELAGHRRIGIRSASHNEG